MNECAQFTMLTQYSSDHLGGGLDSQSLNWYWQQKYKYMRRSIQQWTRATEHNTHSKLLRFCRLLWHSG